MPSLVFKNRLVQIVAATTFIGVITLFGFSSYTYQTVEQYAEPHIYRNPSQLPTSQIAYLPTCLIKKLGHSPEIRSWLADRLWDLHDSGCLGEVACSGDLVEALSQHGVPVIPYSSAQSTTVHNEVIALINDLSPSSLLIIADENYLEQGLYSLKTLNIKAAGWDYRRDRGEVLHPSQYFSHVRLYFECAFSRPNPLIANPRYTLDIQH